MDRNTFFVQPQIRGGIHSDRRDLLNDIERDGLEDVQRHAFGCCLALFDESNAGVRHAEDFYLARTVRWHLNRSACTRLERMQLRTLTGKSRQK